MHEKYGIDYTIKSFAVANEFSATMNKVCYKLGKQLKPFSLCSDKYQAGHGVLDLATFGGLEDGGIPILEDIARCRQEDFKIAPVAYESMSPEMKHMLFVDYLLCTSICYIEVEKWKTEYGQPTPTYDKMLATRNPAIMAAWMGLMPAEMQAKYSRRIQYDKGEQLQNIIRYVRLNTSAKGNSISVPRNFVATDKMRCVPLYMLNAWVSGAKTVMDNNIVKFTFLKDNHTERELCTTLSQDIIIKYYDDNNFIASMLSGVDIDTEVQGGMHLSSKIHRGYIKLPELGASIYDSGTRSLNIARILKAEIVDDIDTTFINVSLDAVVDNFRKCIDYVREKYPQELRNIYVALTKEEDVEESAEPLSYVVKLEKYVSEKDLLFTTSFRRLLHVFLVSNPQWFPFYTGRPLSTAVGNANNMGVADFNF